MSAVGGKPSKGTKADGRLKGNKGRKRMAFVVGLIALVVAAFVPFTTGTAQAQAFVLYAIRQCENPTGKTTGPNAIPGDAQYGKPCIFDGNSTAPGASPSPGASPFYGSYLVNDGVEFGTPYLPDWRGGSGVTMLGEYSCATTNRDLCRKYPLSTYPHTWQYKRVDPTRNDGSIQTIQLYMDPEMN